MYLGRRDLIFPAALTTEWLHTNGLGGYASSSVLDVNTRRYHGWLVAASEPPSVRMLALSRFLETAVIQDRTVDFSSVEYPGTFAPRGFQHLLAFWDDPVPSFEYLLDGARLVRQVYTLDGKNACVVVYTLVDSDRRLGLRLRPLVNWRHFHTLAPAPHPGWRQSGGERHLSLEPPSGHRIVIAWQRGSYQAEPVWYHRTLYREELARGLDNEEELFSPGILRADMGGQDSPRLVVMVGLEEDVKGLDIVQLSLPDLCQARQSSGLIDTLCRTSRTYIVRRGHGRSIIAGYHWFADWGRDTMISLPGITLVTGRHQEARRILETWAQSSSKGLIPNRFDDSGETPEWNSVDAPLWFAYALWKYWTYTEDGSCLRDLAGVLEDILDNYARGTLFGISMDASGLVRAGQHGLQLTWMDAKVRDEVVTQRAGYAVEVNALWYNALLCASDMLRVLGRGSKASQYESVAARVRKSFTGTFWNGAYLVDAVPHGPELRPNQILAASLPYSPLEAGTVRQVLHWVGNGLYTPYGLRTLEPSHPLYNGRYEGSVEQRDRAYHQGTAWPWFLGQYITAQRRAGASPADLWRYVLPFESHLREAGTSAISEIFDGDPPHTPRGCISQAWSVAEVLRAIKEDILGDGPGPVHGKENAS